MSVQPISSISLQTNPVAMEESSRASTGVQIEAEKDSLVSMKKEASTKKPSFLKIAALFISACIVAAITGAIALFSDIFKRDKPNVEDADLKRDRKRLEEALKQG